MNITNKDRFDSEVTFLDQKDVKQIGTIGNDPLYIVGREIGSDAPVVCQTTGDISTTPLFAVPLYELLNHTQAEVNITGDV